MVDTQEPEGRLAWQLSILTDFARAVRSRGTSLFLLGNLAACPIRRNGASLHESNFYCSHRCYVSWRENHWTTRCRPHCLRARCHSRRPAKLFQVQMDHGARPSILFGSGSSLPVDGVAIALLGALFAAAAYVTVRKLGESEHPLVVVFYFPLVSVPLVLPIVIFDWVMPTPREWLLLFGVGLATQFAQVFMTRGLHKLPAGRATAIGYLQIVFATGWGWLVYQTLPDQYGIAGALMIIGGVLLTRSSEVRESSANRGAVIDS